MYGSVRLTSVERVRNAGIAYATYDTINPKSLKRSSYDFGRAERTAAYGGVHVRLTSVERVRNARIAYVAYDNINPRNLKRSSYAELNVVV